VIDPANHMDQRADVAIRDGKIAAVGTSLPGEAVKTIDVSGLIVTPGLIDCHCHVYPTFPQAEDRLYNINADAHMLQSGVTTVIDAGTCGWRDFMRFKETVIDVSEVRVLAMINIAAGGMVRMQSEQEPSEFNAAVAAEIAKAYGDIVVAIKTAHYWTHRPFTDERKPWTSVDAAIRAGEMAGKPCMFDFYPWLPERPYQGLIERMRPGDVHTHMYAQQFPVLDENGRVSDFLLKAKQRGIRFDLGHGAGSFWFRNAVPAYRQGFVPDTLSSDLYMENIHGAALNLLNIMSKYLCIGMPLSEPIARTTLEPARQFGHPELGTLSNGSCADVAVLKLREGDFGYADCGNACLRGPWRLECKLTVRGGRIAFNRDALGTPEWTEAPAAYWTSPGIIEP
jgi:dihydroorotase